MNSCLLSELAERSGGRVARGGPDIRVERLHTDTRTLLPGDCFVALRGDRFDGHDFVAGLPETGAVAAMVERLPETDGLGGLGLVQVSDTLKGLQDFSRDYRRRMNVTVVAVTGSSGKTSTKEMIAAVLRRRFRTKATQGNLNNHIGVPLTLLGLDAQDEYAVVEMGMNHAGEIAPLMELALPSIGVITNVGSTHIEFLGSREAIAQEKSEVIAPLPADGWAILNSDDPWTSKIRNRTQARVVTAGFAEGSDWRARNAEMTTEGVVFDLEHAGKCVRVSIPLFSRRLVTNALLAAATGGVAGLTLEEIAAGLAEVKLPPHRMDMIAVEGAWIINDAYNANPESMVAALEALHDFPKATRKLAVLGSMGELGSFAAEFHEEVGRAAGGTGLAGLAVVGPHAAPLKAGALAGGLSADLICECVDAVAAAEWAKKTREAGDCLLIKGSRFMKLEIVVAALSGGGKS